MINTLVHGVGQKESSWSKVKELLKENKRWLDGKKPF